MQTEKRLKKSYYCSTGHLAKEGFPIKIYMNKTDN
jgi:hypothetical protein